MTLVWAALVMLVVVLGLRFLNQRQVSRRREALDALAAQLGLGSAEYDALGVPGRQDRPAPWGRPRRPTSGPSPMPRPPHGARGSNCTASGTDAR
jgi:hypothetical protein